MITQFFRALLGKNFPRNPEAEALSQSELRAISVGAVLAAVRIEYWDSLETSKTGNSRKTLHEWWSISCPQTAIETLEGLKNKKHSRMYNVILATNARRTWGQELHFEDFIKVYQHAGLPLVDENIAKKYPREAELVEPHISTLHKMSEGTPNEEINQTLEKLFGDDETINLCVQIYKTALDKYDSYTHSTSNLTQTFNELIKFGIVSSQSDLGRIDATAWDMGRMVNVARWCYELKFISKAQAWEYIFHGEKESVARYNDWAAFGRSYITGRALWGGSGIQLTNTINIVDSLHKNEESPWNQFPLK